MSKKMLLVNAARSIPGLRNALWQARRHFYAAQRHVFIRRPVSDGSGLIENALINRIPFVAGKMGSIEALGLQTYLKRRKARMQGRKIPPYGSYNFHTLHVNAGIFPKTEDSFDRFGELYLGVIKNCDALAAWDVAGEAEIFGTHCTEATLITLKSLEPYFAAVVWSRALKGKRVLVISPFTETIKKQYARRETLWDDPELLPPFELLTLRAPFSAGLVPPDAPDWFTALDRMKAQMDTMQYDVVLVGAGAFSLPLAVHGKTRGKVGVHLGGSLQILFGVIGNRWKENKNFKAFIKPSWCGPSKEETPDSHKAIEGGCYW